MGYQVSLPTSRTIVGGGRPFTLYHIIIETESMSFCLKHRYSTIRDFNKKLKSRYDKHVALPSFPGKKFGTGNMNPVFIEKRRIDLEQYLRDLFVLPFILQCEEFQLFLLSSETLQEDRNEDFEDFWSKKVTTAVPVVPE